MKKLLPLVLIPIVFIFLSSFLTTKKSTKKTEKNAQKVEQIINRYKVAFEAVDYDIEKFMQLTPSKYREVTGKKLSLRESFELKQVQKSIKSLMNNKDGISAGGDEKMPQWAYILLVILGWGFIPIGILSDWKGNDWWVNLLLSICFWIPGVIHGLIVMKKYY